MIKIKATRKTKCAICGCDIKRRKTFTIFNSSIDGIQEELLKKTKAWKLTGKQKHCNICWSVKDDLR